MFIAVNDDLEFYSIEIEKEEPNGEHLPNRALFCAVIAQAFRDLESKEKERRDSTYEWFQSDTANSFIHFAGLRSHVGKIMAKVETIKKEQDRKFTGGHLRLVKN